MAVSPRSTSVGLAGLGNLGLPLAATLVRAGWDLAVLDSVPERAKPVVALGAKAVPDVRGLADRDVLVLAVPDDVAVEQVLDGYLARGRSGRAVVVHSTVLPQTAKRLAEVAAGQGVELVDAPVSGGAERAASGTLTVLAGGEPAALERLRPLLDTVGDPVLHVGPVGAGAAAKLANQLTMFANLAGVYEAIDFANAHGVATEALLTGLKTSLGDSWVARNLDFWDRTAAAYDRSGTPVSARPWSKDLAEVVQAARDRARWCGARCLVAREPLDWLDPGLMAELAASDLAWDVVAVTDAQVEAVVALARRVPELRIVVDHLARPPLETGDLDGWAAGLAALAGCPNVALKVSIGIDLLTSWPRWEPAALVPAVAYAVAAFGPDRLMLASNWPVVTLRADYVTALRDLDAAVIAAGVDAKGLAEVRGGTAARWYHLPRS